MIKFKPSSYLFGAAIAATLSVGTTASAVTSNPLDFRSGDGQSIASGDVDLQTSFAGITNFTTFNSYQNNGVSVTVNDTNINTSAGGFFNSLNTTQSDGFAYGNNGNNSWFTVAAASGADLFGIEFQYGNGIFSDQLNLEWVALNNGSVVDTGVRTNAQRGSFYGISGFLAFDEVRLSAYRTSDKNNCDNDVNCTSPIQFLALDNVRLDITPNVIDNGGPSPVPLPAAAGLLLSALGSLAAFRRFRRS